MNLLQRDQQKWDRFEKQFSLIPLKYYFSASIQLSFNAFTVTFFSIKALLLCFKVFFFYPTKNIFVLIALVRSQGSDEPALPHSLTSHTHHNNIEDEEESDQNLDL